MHNYFYPTNSILILILIQVWPPLNSFLETGPYPKYRTLNFPFLTRISDLPRFCTALSYGVSSTSLHLIYLSLTSFKLLKIYYFNLYYLVLYCYNILFRENNACLSHFPFSFDLFDILH